MVSRGKRVKSTHIPAQPPAWRDKDDFRSCRRHSKHQRWRTCGPYQQPREISASKWSTTFTSSVLTLSSVWCCTGGVTFGLLLKTVICYYCKQRWGKLVNQNSKDPGHATTTISSNTIKIFQPANLIFLEPVPISGCRKVPISDIGRYTLIFHSDCSNEVIKYLQKWYAMEAKCITD